MKWKILSKLGACLEVKCLFDLFEEWGQRPFGVPEHHPRHLVFPFLGPELPELIDLRVLNEGRPQWVAIPPKPVMEGQVWRDPHYDSDFCVTAYREMLAVPDQTARSAGLKEILPSFSDTMKLRPPHRKGVKAKGRPLAPGRIRTLTTVVQMRANEPGSDWIESYSPWTDRKRLAAISRNNGILYRVVKMVGRSKKNIAEVVFEMTEVGK